MTCPYNGHLAHSIHSENWRHFTLDLLSLLVGAYKHSCVISTGMLGEESWPPVSTFYDFLAVMDKNDPSSARQQQPTREMEDGEGNGGRGVALEERTDGSNRSPTHPESSPNPHTEL